MKLPRPFLHYRWIKAHRLPDRKRFGKYGLILDTCWNRDGSIHSLKVAYVRDHPFLRDTLSKMPHVPRAVRSIYQAQTRLGMAMAMEAWANFRRLDAADQAWADYLAAMARMQNRERG